jgi:3-oxoacyl-[acyl-carrier-protein] synthase-3
VKRARILGVGAAVPPRIVTNDDLSRRMDTSDEWIQQRTGIRERRYIEVATGATELGARAAEAALAEAKLDITDIDLVVFATLSPDIDWPACAGLLAARLGAPQVRAFDVRNQCSGFLYGLACADALLRTGVARRALLVGGEIHSTGLDLTTRGREVSVIFGDGAGAVVLGPSDDPERGLLSTHLHAEGKYAEKLWLESAGSRKNRTSPSRISREKTLPPFRA